MNQVISLAANTIILYGSQPGVYSPSHPQIYPPPQVIQIPSVIIEQPYTPEYTFTDELGNPYIR